MRPYRTHLMICAGTACVSNKSFEVKAALEEEIKNRKGGILYVGNLRNLVPEEEIFELEKMTDTDYAELDEIEDISAETVAKMKETLAESLNILNS